MASWIFLIPYTFLHNCQSYQWIFPFITLRSYVDYIIPTSRSFHATGNISSHYSRDYNQWHFRRSEYFCMKEISICTVQTNWMAFRLQQWISIYQSLHKSTYSRCDSPPVNGNEEGSSLWTVSHLTGCCTVDWCYIRKYLIFPCLHCN